MFSGRGTRSARQLFGPYDTWCVTSHPRKIARSQSLQLGVGNVANLKVLTRIGRFDSFTGL